MPVFTLRALQTLAASFVALLLAGCESAAPPPIDVRAIGQVQAEIKKQVGMYVLAARAEPVLIMIDGKYVDIRERKELFWCGDGSIDYDISEVKARLTTSLVTSAGFSLDLKAPTPITAGGGLGFTRSVDNSQALEYNLWPLGPSLQPDEFKNERNPSPEALATAPIAQVLLGLRQAQITGATRINYVTGEQRPPQPCFSNFDPAKPAADAGHTFTVGLTVTTSVDGKVSVGVSVLELGASAGAKTATGHSLTVKFVQRGLEEMQQARDRVEAECKPPNRESPACKKATAEYKKKLEESSIGTMKKGETRVFK
ncbi:MAG: hypothetical protein LCH93_06725 [Proteobacteria bacterium]|nr:hypothetical protein [Pseudomonadota bacterium]